MNVKTFASTLTLFCLTQTVALAKIQVITTTEDLASLAREVGGEAVIVESIAKGYQDPHFVEAKPSHLLKLKKADLFVQVGLELEAAWAPALLTNARNPKILPGRDGFLDASKGCDILQRPTGGIDRSGGDVHPFGNPHYWLDPANGLVIARNITQQLSKIDPPNASVYRENLARFEAALAAKEKEWSTRAAPLKKMKIVTYHNSWPNFVKRFGLEVVNFIEPKPGIPPSSAHVRRLIEHMKTERVRLILIEPYFDTKLSGKIAKETGARLVEFPPSVGAKDELRTYIDLFDHNLNLLLDALRQEVPIR